jgi:uncharacterized phage infection (PIP) family protein YhgE
MRGLDGRVELTRLPPVVLVVLAVSAGLTCQLLLGTSYVAASLDPLLVEGGLPVAVVILDAGRHGSEFFDGLQAHKSPIRWEKVSSRDAMIDALTKKATFGAMVIPENFSANIDSFASQTPRAAFVETWTNPGASTSGALIAGRAIEVALDELRDIARAQALQGAQVATTGLGGLTLAQGHWLAQPVQTRAEVANAVPVGGANGLAPTYLAMGAWIGGYLGSVALERFRPRTGLRALPRAAIIAGAALLQGALATGAAIVIGLGTRDVAQLAFVLTLGTWMAYCVVSLLMDIFGIAGVLPAFALLAMGLPASGAIYPEGLLPELYRSMHAVDPFTWLIEMLRTTLYAPGAGDVAGYALALVALALACTGASLALDVWRDRVRPERDNVHGSPPSD